MSDEAKKYGAQGGKKRAANMTKEQRSEAARKAVLTRWGGGELPKVLCGSPDRPLVLGDIQIQCFVLEDERRVLVQRGLQTGIGMSTSGGTSGAHRMARFIASLEAKGVKTKDLSLRMGKPIVFRVGGLIGYGYEASILSDICRAVLEARRLGVLTSVQGKYAEACEQLLGAFAEHGINALVDEATGFRDLKQQHDIARFIEQYVAKEMRQWVPTFPRSFFEQLCRLRDIPFPEDMRLPQYIGHDINNLVWSRLAPGVREVLRNRNPVVNGRRQHKHHQFLTNHIGHPKLVYHLGRLEGIASGFERGQFEQFKTKVNIELPSHISLPLFTGVAAEAKLPRAKRRALPSSSSASSSPAGETSPAS